MDFEFHSFDEIEFRNLHEGQKVVCIIFLLTNDFDGLTNRIIKNEHKSPKTENCESLIQL